MADEEKDGRFSRIAPPVLAFLLAGFVSIYSGWKGLEWVAWLSVLGGGAVVGWIELRARRRETALRAERRSVIQSQLNLIDSQLEQMISTFHSVYFADHAADYRTSLFVRENGTGRVKPFKRYTIFNWEETKDSRPFTARDGGIVGLALSNPGKTRMNEDLFPDFASMADSLREMRRYHMNVVGLSPERAATLQEYMIHVRRIVCCAVLGRRSRQLELVVSIDICNDLAHGPEFVNAVTAFANFLGDLLENRAVLLNAPNGASSA